MNKLRKINTLYRDILLSEPESAPISAGGGQKLFYVDLSKLCNLGTYQEIGKNVIMKLLQKEIFISKNTFFLVFMLNSQQKIEQNKIYGQNC